MPPRGHGIYAGKPGKKKKIGSYGKRRLEEDGSYRVGKGYVKDAETGRVRRTRKKKR